MKEYIKPNIEVLYLVMEDLLLIASKKPEDVDYYDYEGGAEGYDPESQI